MERRASIGRPATRTPRWYALVALLVQVAGDVAEREQVDHRRSVGKSKVITRDANGRLRSVLPEPPSPIAIAAEFTNYSPETIARACRTATTLGLLAERTADSVAFLPPGYLPPPTARRPHWRRQLTDSGVSALGVAPEGWRGHWPTFADPWPAVESEHAHAMLTLLAHAIDDEKTLAARVH
jgi:hypothetical protein